MPIFILPVVFLSRFTLLRPILIQDSVRRGGLRVVWMYSDPT